MSIIGSNALAGASGQAGGGGGGGGATTQIDRSLRFVSGDSAYLNRTPSSAGNRKTWTWSGWVKRSGLGAYDFLFMAQTSSVLKSSLSFWNGDYIRFKGDYNDGTARSFSVSTNALFRDPSAWYHVVCRLDTTQATAADRIKIWVNGVEQTFSSATYPTQDSDIELNNNSAHLLGSQTGAPQNGLDGYLADVHFIDGQTLAETDFGEYDANNVWQPKAFGGGYNGGYNQSQNWTDNTTLTFYGNASAGASTTLDNVFDSSITTGLYAVDSGATGSGLVYKIAFPSGVRGSKVRVRACGDGGYGAALNTETVSDLVAASSSYEWVTIYDSTETDINYIVFGNVSGARDNVTCAIEIDGLLLTDSDISTPDNSFHLDFSDNSSNAALGTDSSGNSNDWTVNNLTANAVTYSNDLTASTGGFGLSSTAEDAFDGSLTTSAYSPSGGSITWTPSTPISYSSSVEVYSYQSPGDEASLNGGTAVSLTSGQWTAVDTGSGTITSLVVSDSANRASLAGIRVDGTILVDSAATNTDSLIDTPTNYEAASGNNGGNYATLNPLDASGTAPVNGNLDFTTTNAQYIRATMAMNVKTYFEVTVNTAGTGGLIGIRTLGDAIGTQTAGDSYAYHSSGAYFVDGANGGSWGSSYGAVDVIGIAYNPDDNEITAYINGTSQGTKTGLDSDKAFAPWIHAHTCSYSVNFGQRPFAHTPPTGYVSLCTTNLPDPTITPSEHFDIDTYAAATAPHDRSEFSFEPGALWVKSRDLATHHLLVDDLRGATTHFSISGGGTEVTSSTRVTGFTNDGFTLGSDNDVNGSNDYVAWAWKAATSNTQISAGSLNSYLYDQSRTWSGGTSSGTLFSGAWTQVFNNVETNTYSDGNSVYVYQNTATLNFSPALPTGAIQIWGRAGSSSADGDKVTFSDGTNTYTTGDLSNQTAQWIDVDSGNSLSGITSVTVHSGEESGAGMVLGAIRIGGKKLVNSSISVSTPSIASTVRANPSAGFSICEFESTGSNGTVAHGLNAQPYWFWVKRRTSDGFHVYHHDLGPEKFLRLDVRDAEDTRSTTFQDTAPTSSVIYIGTDGGVNPSTTEDVMIYAWAPVEGYSAFGSYIGNASSDGPFVYTGFSPKFVLFKNKDSAQEWMLYDVERQGFNANSLALEADEPKIEKTNGFDLDILSNGFKVRNGNVRINGNTSPLHTILYMAFAEHPFKTARAR